MTTVKLPKTERMKLVDAINNKEAVTVKISSRMIVDPDQGVNGSVKLPLTATQIAKLNKSKRATNFNLSKTQIRKLIRGNGFFGSLWSGVKKAGEAIGKTTLKVGEKVGSKLLDTAVDAAITAAPMLLLGAGNPEAVKPRGRKVKGTIGVASIRGVQGLGIGEPIFNIGGEGGSNRGKRGVMRRRDGIPKPNQNVSSTFHITDT